MIEIEGKVVEIHSYKNVTFAGFPITLSPEVANSDTLVDMGSVVKIVKVDKESDKHNRMSESIVPTTAGKLVTAVICFH